LLAYQGLNVVIKQDARAQVDLEIVSVFPRRAKIIRTKVTNILMGDNVTGSLTGIERNFSPRVNGSAKRRIWYTGENVRPPIDLEFNGFMSFDQRYFGDQNVYFPLWMHDIGWFDVPRFNQRLGKSSHVNELTSGRVPNSESRNGFCVFVGNPDPVRIRAVDKLSEVMESGLFGSYFRNPVKNKLEVASRYRFMVCFENDLYPGYVTEKIVEAYLSGTIPLYWGDLGSKRDNLFNHKAFLNLNDFETLDEFVSKVLESDKNWLPIFAEPLLSQKPNLDKIVHCLTGY
jgi:hypothetical protein